MDNTESRSSQLGKGIFAGLIAGLAASVVMNQFQKLIGNLVSNDERSHGAQSLQQGTPDHGIGAYLADHGVDSDDDTAPARLANAAAVALTGQALDPDTKESAGVALHYAYGTSMAAFYGAAAEIVPQVTAGYGTAYGAAVWLGADEAVVPAMGLSRSALEYPPSIHLYALSSHLVYGLTTELVRRAVRNAL